MFKSARGAHRRVLTPLEQSGGGEVLVHSVRGKLRGGGVGKNGPCRGDSIEHGTELSIGTI